MSETQAPILNIRYRMGPRTDPEAARAMGDRVMIRRDALGLTQRQIAERSGCTREMISMIENAKSMPSAVQVPGLCRALEFSPNQLFGWGADLG